jgi:O-antigen/teichoic acid export membrane protein
VLLAAAAPIASHLLRAPDLRVAIQLYALVVPARMVATGVASAVLRLHGRYHWITLKSVAFAALRLPLMTGPALLGFGVTGVLLGALIGEALNCLVLIAMLRLTWKHRCSDQPLFDTRPTRELTGAARALTALWFSASLKALQLETFIPITAALASPTAVGVLRLGLDIGEVLLKATAPLSVVLFPSVVSAYMRKGSDAGDAFILRSVGLLAIVVTPVAACALACAP